MNPRKLDSFSVDAIRYSIHHVVLPPKLPQADDRNEKKDRKLIEMAILALNDLKALVKVEDVEVVTAATSTITNLLNCRDIHGNISEAQLSSVLSKFVETETYNVLPIEVKAQNAGILVSRCDRYIVLEFFELSPANEAAMQTKGRLVRMFPENATRIPISTMGQEGVRKMLAQTIAKMSTQAVLGTQPQEFKEKRMHDEPRDTTSPTMVVGYLMNITAALGETTEAKGITKNTREEILWHRCTAPWRRSPLWLLLRASLHLFFARAGSDAPSPDCLYKAFMLLLLAKILENANNNSKIFDSETLYMVSAKLLRRLRKFELLRQGDYLQPDWMDEVRATIERAYSLMDEQWRDSIQGTKRSVDTVVICRTQPEDSLKMTLPKLDTFIHEIFSRPPPATRSDFRPASTYLTFPAHELPKVELSPEEDGDFFLIAIEKWVENHLQSWIMSNSAGSTTCGRLRSLIEKYHSIASSAYAGNPISMSIMHLTLVELWIACDKSACHIHPMLQDYNPELDVEELQCLVLPLKTHMKRLSVAENYIESRRSKTLSEMPSIYREFGHAQSFAVRFFDQSRELTVILEKIKSDAVKKRQKKVSELANLKTLYKDLIHRYDNSHCETQEVVVNRYYGYTEIEHSDNCSRCNFKKKADDLAIYIYEWPVSSNPSAAKATVFELRTPEAFSKWRDASLYLILDVLGSIHEHGKKPQDLYTLDKHHDLSHLLSPHYQQQRIVPLSSIKSHTTIHRRIKGAVFNLEEDDICLQNALHYEYYDQSRGVWNGSFSLCEEVPRRCMYQLPPRSESLQRYLYKPPSAGDGVYPNEVAATLSECPTHFSIDEYKGFGSLPFGRNILYQNILHQLAAPSLDFSRLETQHLISQTIYQAGPSNGHIERVSHLMLTDTSFCDALIDRLEDSIRRLSENWESWRALLVFSRLASRTLGLSLSKRIRQRSLDCLSKVREICTDWISRLKERVAGSVDEKQRTELNSRASEIALLGTNTFDIEDEFIDDVFQHLPSISMLLQFSILMQENQHSMIPESSDDFNIMVQAWRSLMYRVFPKLLKNILRDNKGINQAVTSIWSSFQPASDTQWSSLDGQQRHWLHVKSGSLPVHFNLLTAELLVNGLPLASAPPEYMHHPMWTPLFHHSKLEVIPTDKAGMNFRARSIYHGHELHFGMREQDMLIVALNGISTFDLVPSRVFVDQLPHAFVEDFVHWYDHNNDEIIFRPLKHPWSHGEPTSWYLRHEDSSWCLIRGAHILVDTNSHYARTISPVFKPLEDDTYIHILFDRISQNVEIELPRVRLQFFITPESSHIHSRQYRGRVVSDDQQIGTLMGLEDTLVLHHADRPDDRIVLIPEGMVNYTRSFGGCYTSVNIAKGQVAKVHAYGLDTILRRVVDNGDLQSKLWCCYMHALTSSHLPDPLTNCTGTESALKILKSAAVRSFECLDTKNIELLARIAGLSPVRTFYPSHKKVMQEIDWDGNLPSLSQHGSFYTCVQEILDHWKRMKLFHSAEVFTEPKIVAQMQPHLLERDAIRSSAYRVAGFGAEQFTSDEDVIYTSRSSSKDSERGRRAFIAASMVLRSQATLHTSVEDLYRILMDEYFKDSTIIGSCSILGPSFLRYDSRWLKSLPELLREYWCSLYKSLTTYAGNYDRYSTMAWLSAMAYSESADMGIIQALAAFYRAPAMFWTHVPPAKSFELSCGITYRHEEIRRFANDATKPISSCPEAQYSRYYSESNREHTERMNESYWKGRDNAVRLFVADLEFQWPCERPHPPISTEIKTYMNVLAATEGAGNRFEMWYNNRCFSEYLRNVSTTMRGLEVVYIVTPQFDSTNIIKRCNLIAKLRHIGTKELLNSGPASKAQEVPEHPIILREPPCEPRIPTIEQLNHVKNGHSMRDPISSRLDRLCRRLETSMESRCAKDYVQSLRASCEARDGITEIQPALVGENTRTLLQEYLLDCHKYHEYFNLALASAVTEGITAVEELAFSVKQFPRLSPAVWLSHLNQEQFNGLSEPWRSTLINYGLATTSLHRAQRLFSLSPSPTDLSEELSHAGHSNWSPQEFPETLLFEAENGVMVREVQEVIAEQMRSPPAGKNTICQLSMGEGKSSIIVPIVANALANRETLVRVVVARPQRKQMLQMLVSKLGGLLGRPIYHMPFSRSTQPSAADASIMRNLIQECIQKRGILLVQPENILSFKLMGVECLLAGKHDVAHSLLDTQQFLDRVSRDLVDESDENFSVKFELVYTMGSQRLVGFAPERWLVIQEILGLIPRYASEVESQHPLSIEVKHEGNARFPRIRIFKHDAADKLLNLLATGLIENGSSGLPTRSQPPDIRAAIFRYVTQLYLDPGEAKDVENSRFWTESTKFPLLLIRGLIAGDILRFALMEKRWRVNFGLDPNRTPYTKLAVPYRSKDCPSPRSEFSHPDVVIVFTLLSYYYGGLGDEELFDSFTHLLRSDQADIYYHEWVSDAPNLADEFQQLSGVSTKDRVLCMTKLFPDLRYSKAAIDYYLSHFVFPKEMKEFPHKMCASGWDLGAIKLHPTTGFSGTNDTLHLLPLHVNHLDLPSQRHTNAHVLGHILRDETSVELLLPHIEGTDAEHLLKTVSSMTPEVRVILDVGALILEMDNFAVASRWLSMNKNDQTQAIVFFQDEELSVLDHTGAIESFQTSPFSKQLDVCLVYLDESHTRGTDLKLPRDYRAAVTLGANLTKDRLVQACMRMRKLGKGQSVAFVVPQEISTKINDRDNRQHGAPIGVDDVLCWSIGETWLDLAKSMPLWAIQGRRFEEHKNLLHGACTPVEQAEKFLEAEAWEIEDRYKPHAEHCAQFEGWDTSNDNIARIISRCQAFGVGGLGPVGLQEEQERELSPEIEEEKQVERPAKMDAAQHRIHPHLETLISTGKLSTSDAFKPAFQALSTTSAAELFELAQFPSDMLVTTDFMRTVKTSSGSPAGSYISDPYQRPVQWVLSVLGSSSASIQKLVILSPYEVNHLLADIKHSATVTLHIFSPRFNASFSSLDRLDLYNSGRNFAPGSIAQSVTMQLNLFAGSLYLQSMEEYSALCDALGLLRNQATDGQRVFPDGFIDPPKGRWGFRSSPVPFLRALLMKVRKEGEGVEKTHLGKILSGLRLEETDFS